MDKIHFQNIVQKMVECQPLLFALDSDAKADEKAINDIEKYYNIILPKAYKEFLTHYGGGYFGYIVIYSCDCDGMFYIKNEVHKEWMIEKGFLPVIDFETGDYLGFEIEEGKCKDIVTMYCHEENELNETYMDFYEAIIHFGLHFSEADMR